MTTPIKPELLSEERLKKFSRLFCKSESGCWNWVGCKNPAGYGYVSRSFYGEGLAHRASWRLHKGEIPAGLHVCHRCNNPSCVNPDHLYTATNAQNLKDAWRDGLCVNQNSKKERCPRCGSDFKIYKQARYCAECRKVSNRRTRKERLEKTRQAIDAAIAQTKEKE